MHLSTGTTEKYWLWLRRLARLLAVGLIGLVLLFAFGEDLLTYLRTARPDPVELLLFVAMGTTIAGLLLAFFREGWGGLLAVLGTAAFVAINSLAFGRFRIGVIDAGFLLVGLLFVIDAWHRRRHESLF